MDCNFNFREQHHYMNKFKRPRILILFGSLLLLITVLWTSFLFNATRNFNKLQELTQNNPSAVDLRYYCAAYRRGPNCHIYTLAVEWDLRFYPNKFILITKFDNHSLVVDLISGPGPENVITLTGELAWQYLATMGLNLPH